MAKKKEKFPYKYISPEELKEFKKMGKKALVDELTRQHSNLKLAEQSKKGSDYLKELRSEIKEFRDTNKPDELEDLQAEINAVKEQRDAEIADSIAELKDLEGGFNDSIKACKERQDVLLGLLSSHT